MTHDGFGGEKPNGENRGKKWGIVGAYALMVFCGLVTSSCCCDKKHSGTIYLDHGEVFTRERLLNERLNNLTWLQNELNNTPAGGTLQGGRYRSESTSFSGQASAQFNPLGGVSPMGQQAIQSSAQAVQLQSQIQTEALQRELNALKTNGISYTNFLNSGGILASPPGTSYGAVSNVSPVINILNSVSGPTNSAPGPSNNFSLPGNIQLTSVEQFQDQLAYRDAVSGEIHEQELDDTHDENGMTLYTINFHLSVAPGENNNCFGRVSANFAKATDDDLDQQYHEWLVSFRNTFDQNVISIQRRYLQNYLTDDEIRQLVADAWGQEEYAYFWLSQQSNSWENITNSYQKSQLALSELPQAFKSQKEFDGWLSTNKDSIGQFVSLEQFVEVITNHLTANQFVILTNAVPAQPKRGNLLQMLQTGQFAGVLGDSSFQSNLCGIDDENKLSISNEWLSYLMDGYDSKTNRYQELTEESTDLKAVMQNFGLISKRSHTSVDLADDSKVMKALCWVVKDEFEEVNDNPYPGYLVDIRTPELVSQNNQDFMYLMKVAAGRDWSGNFSNEMQTLESKAPERTFVYAIEPKEYAQNLMDESDEQNSLSLALGLSAAIPQISTSLSAYLQYLQQNQYMLETIKRRPLLTSYMDGNTNFGWLVGGRFKISDKDKDYKLTYEQVPVQEAVQVTLEVPSWWTAVTINTTSQWLQANSHPICAGQTNSRVIALKPDYSAVTRALMEEYNPGYTKPQIYPAWDPNQNTRGYVVQAGAPATLLILGQNLWRNPVVFIGSQSTADTFNYNVLPDMQGIVANFSQGVNYPPTLSTNSGQPVTVDLRVVTSDGEAVLRDGVTIISGNSVASPSQGFVSMTNFFGMPGSNITFNVSAVPLGSVLATYQLALSPANARPQPVCTNTIKNGVLTFTLPAANANLGTTSSVARIDVWMQQTPGSEPVSVLQGGEQNFIVFNNFTNSEFAWAASSVTFSATNNSANPNTNNTLIIQPPPGTDANLFWSAQPGLSQQLQSSSGQIQLQLANTATPNSITNLNYGTFNGTNIQFLLSNIPNIQPLTNAFNLTNSGQAVCTGTIAVSKYSVPVAGNITFARKD